MSPTSFEGRPSKQHSVLEKKIEDAENGQKRGLETPELRTIQRSVDAMRFRYGELDQDHETARYVNSLASKLQPYEDFPFQVHVLPDMHEVNAGAYADGTVFLSAGIIRKVQTPEALQGVFAHEYTHVYREHIKKKNKKTKEVRKDWAHHKPNFIELARLVSLGRLHETEADLRPFVERLDQSGINPLGVKMFFGERDKFQKRSTAGGSHGSDRGRALNMDTVLFHLDLTSIDIPLGTIPEHVVKALDHVEGKHTYASLALRPRNHVSRLHSLEDLQAERGEAVDQLPDDLLPAALTTVFQYARGLKLKRAPADVPESILADKDDDIVFRKLVRRFMKTLPSGKGLPYSLCALHLFGGVPVFAPYSSKESLRSALIGSSDKKAIVDDTEKEENLPAFVELRKRARELLAQPDGFEQMTEALAELSKTSPHPYTMHGTFYFLQDAISTFAKEQRLDKESGSTSTFGILQERIQSLGDTLIGISEQFDCQKVDNVSDYVDEAKDVLGQKISHTLPLGKELRLWKVEKTYDLDGEIIAKITEFGTRLAASEKKKDAEEIFPQIESDFFECLKEATPTQVGTAISLFVEVYTDCRLHLQISDTDAVLPRNYAPRPISYFADGNTITFQLFLSAFKAIPSLQKKSRFEQRALLYATARRLNFSLDEEDSRYDEDDFGVDVHKERRDALVAPHLQKKLVLQRESSTEEVAFFCKLLENRSFYKENTGLYRVSEFGSGDCARDTAEHIVNRVIQATSFSEGIKKICALEALGVPVYTILENYPDHNGRLVFFLAIATETGETSPVPLTELLRISRLIANPFLRASFETFCKDREWGRYSFAERLDILLPKETTKAVGGMGSLEELFEIDVQTREQFSAIAGRIRERADVLMTEGKAEIGVGMLVEQLTLVHRDPVEILRLLLETKKTDKGVKDALFSGVHSVKKNALDGSDDEVEDHDNDLETLDMEKNDRKIDRKSLHNISDSILQVKRILRSLYTMGDVAKSFLVRQLLTADGGALTTPELRKKCIKMLLTHVVEEKESSDKQDDVRQILEQVGEGLASAADWLLVYFSIEKIIRERIAHPPEKETSFRSLTSVQQELTDTRATYPEIEKVFQRSGDNHRIKVSLKEKDGVLATHLGEEKLKKVLEKEYRQERDIGTGKLRPIEFVQEMAGNTGALGARFGQNIHLLSREVDPYEEDVSQIYDQVRGQSKLNALRVLEREWPDLWSVYERIGERIGGGSMVTVYKGFRPDGSVDAVKVRNPNITYRLRRMYDFSDELVVNLEKKYGGSYGAARGLLRDTKRWIDKDISFEGFLEDDARFYIANHGFRRDNSAYTVRIPRSFGPANPRFSREEYVQANNLTKWDELSGRYDMKDIVSTVAASYVQQVLHGQALSDVHIGNIGVTDEQELVIYDRNYFLHIDDREKEVLLSFAQGGEITSEENERLLTYISLENSSVSKDVIRSFTDATTGAIRSGAWKEAQRILVRMAERKIEVPLQMTLLLKNIQSIHRMTEKAGFTGGIREALMYES